MTTIVLISCASKKSSQPTKARDLYTSPLFRLSLAHAQALSPDEIYILSAKHGLLSLDTVIEPYDITLNDLPAKHRQQWARDVLQQLNQEAALAQDHFIFLVGEKYRRHLISHIHSYHIPMEGLPIGKQLQYLKAKVEV